MDPNHDNETKPEVVQTPTAETTKSKPRKFNVPAGALRLGEYGRRLVPRTARIAPLVLGIIGLIFIVPLPLIVYCVSIPGLVMCLLDFKRKRPVIIPALIINIVALISAAINSYMGYMDYLEYSAIMA